MKKFVETTVSLSFNVVNESGSEPDDQIIYESNQVGPGFLCVVGYEDEEQVLLTSVKYPNWVAQAKPGDYAEVNAMEFLAEVHAGNVPDELLEAPPCE